MLAAFSSDGFYFHKGNSSRRVREASQSHQQWGSVISSRTFVDQHESDASVMAKQISNILKTNPFSVSLKRGPAPSCRG